MKSYSNLTPEQLLSFPEMYVKQHSRFQPYPLHFHDWVEINYMYAGSCEQIINNQLYHLKQGQIVLIDTDTIHTINPLGESDILINIMIRKDYLNNNFFSRQNPDSLLSAFFLNTIVPERNHDHYILFNSEDCRRLHIVMQEFLCEWYDPSPNSFEILNSFFSLIILELAIIQEKGQIETDNFYFTSNFIPSALRFIEKNYQTVTLTDLADYLKMNPNYVSNQLKKFTGASFREILQQQRINAANILLKNSQMTVMEIANYVGYENGSFFYKKFYQYNNCSPSEFRKKYKNDLTV